MTNEDPNTVTVHCVGCGNALRIQRHGETTCLCGARHTLVAVPAQPR